MSNEMVTSTSHQPRIRLLKAGDVMTALNVSRSTVYSLMQSGELRTVNFGRLVRVRAEDLEEFISAHTSG